MNVVNSEVENELLNDEVSRKMGLMMILKVTKKQGFTVSLENIFLEKSKVQTAPHPSHCHPRIITIHAPKCVLCF